MYSMLSHGMAWRAAFLSVVGLALVLSAPVAAHDFKAGDLRIDHPYATPTGNAMVNGAVYFKGIKNTGKAPDRLLSARTSVAKTVELHRMTVDGGVMQMRPIDAIELPTKSTVSLQHGQTLHLMLFDLTRPLLVGDRFPLTLQFERAGEHEVMVWVEQPQASTPAAHHH